MLLTFSGHMAPEYLFRGEISIKTDIYSLGLLIIQITTREKNYSDPTDPSARKYVTEVRNYISCSMFWRFKFKDLYTLNLVSIFHRLMIIIPIMHVDTNRLDSRAHSIQVFIVGCRKTSASICMHRNWVRVCAAWSDKKASHSGNCWQAQHNLKGSWGWKQRDTCIEMI